MEYKNLISITGMSGIFELVSPKSNGGLVRSLEDKTTKFVSNRLHNFSQLENIEIYTTRENVNLVEIFNAMAASTEPLPNDKDPKLVKEYFKKVYANMDFERVYDSDRKKMVKWFAILKDNSIWKTYACLGERE
jgi:hypothetical protein